ncbi:HesB/IscA family protein [Brevibacillus sp. TJ4]|uniref:HesB/IscA family protein n=1 Tax=Brevibacillus sp. TJ4 TaxID=3234853 RepID=UPI0037CFF631
MITITPQAAARLSLLISQEPDADQLGIRLLPTTTGCGSDTFGITITEAAPGEQVAVIHGIRLFYNSSDVDVLRGIRIDFDSSTGRFSIFSPRPMQNDCHIPPH